MRLKSRDRQPEVMDQPGLDRECHFDALRGLGRVNAISGVPARLWSRLAGDAAKLDRPFEILDVACGGGDIATALCHLARKNGISVRVSACDISTVALEFAQTRAEKCGAEVRFFQRDLVKEGIDREYDAIVCSLFLHHLPEEQVVGLLSDMAQNARRRVLASDLVRSRWGYTLASLGGRLLSRSKVVHVDGPLSVRAAFTIAEISKLAADAGLVGAKVTRCWPARFLLDWSRQP